MSNFKQVLTELKTKLENCKESFGTIMLSDDFRKMAIPQKLREWIQNTDERIKKSRLIQGEGVIISDTGAGFRIDCEATGLSPVSGEKYTGPFKLLKSGETSVKILGNNPSEDRHLKNYVFLGLEQIEVPETEISSISASSWIFLDITYSDNYSITPSSASELPEQTNAAYYVPLGFVNVEGDSGSEKISSITQVQFGHVHGSGRVF